MGRGGGADGADARPVRWKAAMARLRASSIDLLKSEEGPDA